MLLPSRSLRALAGLSALAFPLFCGACGGDSSSAESDVVMVVLVDTLRHDGLECYGREGAMTPRIDELAREGIRFDQAISSSGWTLPSVASMLTSTWPDVHKATGKGVVLTPIAEELPVAGEVFQKAGYVTLAFVNAAFLSPLLGLDRGFEFFDHRHALNHEIRRADQTVRNALEAIDAMREEKRDKMFLLVHLFDVHLDYDPPAGYRELFTNGRTQPPAPLSLKACNDMRRGEEGELPPLPEDIDYMRALYQGEMAFVDVAVGELVDGLKERGLWEQTTLVLTSDHGEEFWDHNGFEHGHTLYDELIRVPLILRLPGGRDHAGEVIAEQVRTIDIVPTLLDLRGLETPASFDGRSLMPLVEGEPDEPRNAFSQSTLYGGDHLSWRTDRYHFIFDQTPGVEEPRELYDWVNDPREQENLVESQPQLVGLLESQLVRFYADVQRRAKRIPAPPRIDLFSDEVKEYVKSLRALGYAGDVREHRPDGK